MVINRDSPGFSPDSWILKSNPQFFLVVFYPRTNHQQEFGSHCSLLQCPRKILGSKQDQAFAWGEPIGRREKGEGIELRNGKDMDMIDRNMNMDMDVNQWSMQYA